jgi:iron complex transport system ATP-binding protein
MTSETHTRLHPPRLTLEGCSFAYDEKSVLRDVDAVVQPGEFLGIVGPNGAGKTTLLRLLSGQRAPVSGRATSGDEALHAMPALKRARTIAVVPQSEAVMFPWPVYSFVMLGRHPHTRSLGFEGPGDHHAVEEAMEMVGITELASRKVTDLSGGELHRVLIARALAQDAPVLLLDEPNAHLDIRHQVELFELLSHLHGTGSRSIVIITHDLNLASTYCDRLLLMDDGRIAAHGAPRDVLREDLIARHFGVRVGIDEGERPHVRLLRPDGNS